MEKEFNEDSLKEKLFALSRWQRTVFALSICERMYPNFVNFSEQYDYAGKEVLESSLQTVWDLLENNITESDLKEQAEKCYEIAPDTEDYDTVLASSALDAAASISLLMEYFTDGNLNHVIEIASLSRDSVDMYVQESEQMDAYDPELESLILNHPLMQNELAKQRRDIEFLLKLDLSQNYSFQDVKNRWFKTTESNLNIKPDDD